MTFFPFSPDQFIPALLSFLCCCQIQFITVKQNLFWGLYPEIPKRHYFSGFNLNEFIVSGPGFMFLFLCQINYSEKDDSRTCLIWIFLARGLLHVRFVCSNCAGFRDNTGSAARYEVSLYSRAPLMRTRRNRIAGNLRWIWTNWLRNHDLFEQCWHHTLFAVLFHAWFTFVMATKTKGLHQFERLCHVIVQWSVFCSNLVFFSWFLRIVHFFQFGNFARQR